MSWPTRFTTVGWKSCRCQCWSQWSNVE